MTESKFFPELDLLFMLSQSTSFYEFGPFRLYPAEKLLLRYGQEVDLSPRELDFLLLLLRNNSKVLSKEQLLSKVWKDIHVEEEHIHQTVSFLRRRLGNYRIFIQTVPAQGYRFTGEVTERVEEVNSTIAQTRRLKVFLCHSSNDKPTVRDLYRHLLADGIAPWLDEEDLLPGQEWEKAIPKAVKSSDAVIVCLSRGSITKAGYVQKEIKFALDAAQEQPEDTIFIIPLRLEKCDVPVQLRGWQWADYFEDAGYQRLFKALQHRACSLGINV